MPLLKIFYFDTFFKTVRKRSQPNSHDQMNQIGKKQDVTQKRRILK